MVKMIKVAKAGKSTKVTDSKIAKNCFGIPVQTYSDTDVLGKPPDDPKLKREWILLNVEKLMLRGATSPYRIATLVGISHPTARRYMDRVEYRWKVNDLPESKAIAAGEAKARLDLLTRSIWEIYESTTSDSVKLRCLRSLLRVHDSQCIAHGLTANILADMAISPAGEEVVERKKIDHRRLVEIAHALESYLAARDSRIAVVKANDSSEKPCS